MMQHKFNIASRFDHVTKVKKAQEPMVAPIVRTTISKTKGNINEKFR